MGLELVVPVGDGVAVCRISDRTYVVQFSLRSRDPSEIKTRHAVAKARVEAIWASLREGPTRLSQKQVVAISGEVYREFVGAIEEDPGTPDRWDYFLGVIEHVPALFVPPSADPGEPVRGGTGFTILDRALARHNLVVDRDSVARLLQEVRRVLREAAQRLRANAEGDYRPDTNLARFPPVQVAPAQPQSLAGDDATLTEIVEGWWRERKATGTAQSTYVNYRGTIRKFIEFLGHEDAHRITPQDVVGFKDHRLAAGVSARTVKDGDLAALKSVLGWAVDNLRLPTNAAASVKLKAIKARQVRSKSFTDEEAIAILRAASEVVRGGDAEKTWLAKRWVPWLLAYTGARLGEVVQLRKEDLRHEGDHWEIVITPEAGTVKGGRYRNVPLHPHLVELGFTRMAERAADGHLFLEPNRKTGDILGPLQGAKNRVAEFVRGHVKDPNVSPNHAWRHRFITTCRDVGVSEELRGMITGHAGKDVAAREYGGPAGLYREICKLPRFVIDERTEAPVPPPTQGPVA